MKKINKKLKKSLAQDALSAQGAFSAKTSTSAKRGRGPLNTNTGTHAKRAALDKCEYSTGAKQAKREYAEPNPFQQL